MLLFAASGLSSSLTITPRAVSWTQNVQLTLGADDGALAEGAMCIFEGGVTSPCTVHAAQSSLCSCTSPVSPGLLGDVNVALHDAGGQSLGVRLGSLERQNHMQFAHSTQHHRLPSAQNGTLTYFAAEQPPTVFDFIPIGADCSSGRAVVRVRGRNFAPTAGLTCLFGELGESPANFTAASRAAECRAPIKPPRS